MSTSMIVARGLNSPRFMVYRPGRRRGATAARSIDTSLAGVGGGALTVAPLGRLAPPGPADARPVLGGGRASRRLPLRAVDVGAMVDADDVDDVCGVVDSIDDSVGAAARRVVAAQFPDQRFA